MSEQGNLAYRSDDETQIEQVLTEQRQLHLRIGEQNRVLRMRQQNLLDTLEQLQQREADASRLAVVAENALSELQNTQDRLLKTEKLAAIGQLAASISHEIRNPLGAIRNAWFFINTKIQREKMDEREPRIKKLSEIIDREIERCARILGDLLDFARERQLFRSPCNLHSLVTEALSIVAMPQGTIQVRNEVPSELPTAFVDLEQFRQVIINLVQNAVEAVSPETGVVRVLGMEADGWFNLEVIDNGPGLPPEVKERIFEPLFTTKTRGTGLGLSIIAPILQRHGGTLSIESEPGQGARFIAHFPQGSESEGEAPAAGGAADMRHS